jgi:hypothetical protein
VNWSEALVGETPRALVTVTLEMPAVPAGAMAVIEVAEFTTTPVAAELPNLTVAPVTKFVPVIVSLVAPAVGPLFGLNALTVGDP